MSTIAKKSARPLLRRVPKGRRATKSGKPSFADWAKKNAGIADTGIRDLSIREGFDD